MANLMRWRYGDTNPVVVPVPQVAVIEIGDLLFLDNGAANPASRMADELTETENQKVFHQSFIGVAMQHSPAGSTKPIRVATTGVFQFDSVTELCGIGDFCGVTEKASGIELENQKVRRVPTAGRAIGRCAKQVSPAASTVLVDIVSTICQGGTHPVFTGS